MRGRLPWAHSRSSAVLSHPSGIVAPIRDALRLSGRARVPAARARRSAASSAGCCPRCALRVAPQQLAVLLCAQAESGAERQPLEVATQLALLLIAPLLPKEDDRLDGDLGLTHGPPHEQAHVPAYEPACETTTPSACAAAAATSPAGRGPGTTLRDAGSEPLRRQARRPRRSVLLRAGLGKHSGRPVLPGAGPEPRRRLVRRPALRRAGWDCTSRAHGFCGDRSCGARALNRSVGWRGGLGSARGPGPAPAARTASAATGPASAHGFRGDRWDSPARDSSALDSPARDSTPAPWDSRLALRATVRPAPPVLPARHSIRLAPPVSLEFDSASDTSSTSWPLGPAGAAGTIHATGLEAAGAEALNASAAAPAAEPLPRPQNSQQAVGCPAPHRFRGRAARSSRPAP